MDTSGTPFSLSSLLCEEDEASILKLHDESSGIESANPCFVFEDEEEYVENLFGREKGFGSQSDGCSSAGSQWHKTCRLDAIDWTFNVSFREKKFTFLVCSLCFLILFD